MPLAMAVDFGWPWWAFTTIAVAVAVVSLLLLRRLRSPLAHGVLLTLLVEAVVIAVLAPTMMARAKPMSADPGSSQVKPAGMPGR